MIEFDNVTPARFERIHSDAEKAGIALPAEGPNGGANGPVAFHGVSGSVSYARKLGEEAGTLYLSVTHVPSLFGIELISAAAAEDRVRAFVEGVH